MRSACFDNGALLRRPERGNGKRYSEDLVGTHRRVVSLRPIEHIEAAICFCIPETRKACAGAYGGLLERLRRLADLQREICGSGESVEPERVNLDGLADARGHGPAVRARIHPRELRAGLATIEQAVRGIRVNGIARTLRVIGNDFLHASKKLTSEIEITRLPDELAQRVDVPERGVNRVEFRRLAAIRKEIRQHAVTNLAREATQNAPRNFGPSGDERQTGQRDHGVTAPNTEPRVAGNDLGGRLWAFCRSGYEERIGGENQLGNPIGDRRSNRSPCRRKAGEKIALARSLRFECGGAIETRVCIHAENERGRCARLKRDAKRCGVKMILAILHASRALFSQFIIAIPDRSWRLAGLGNKFGRCGGAPQIEWRCAIESGNTHTVRYRGNLHAPIARVGKIVEIAIVDENFQLEGDGRRGSRRMILNVSRVRAVLHPDTFFEPRVSNDVIQNGNAAFQMDAIEIAEALGVNHAAGPAIRAKGERLICDAREFVNFGDE